MIFAKRVLFYSLTIIISCSLSSPIDQNEYKDISIPSVLIDKPSPLTGIVLWEDNEKMDDYLNSVTLEFKYFYYSDVASSNGNDGYVYNWDAVDDFLERAASRGHHGIVRFRDTDPELIESQSALPASLNTFIRTATYSEGIQGARDKTVRFPDWSNPELTQFIVDFYQIFSDKYDTRDSNLAYLEVGFGLWGEYHIDFDNLSEFSDPSTSTISGAMGKLFPSRNSQITILESINSSFSEIPWLISVDSADTNFSPFFNSDLIKELNFGLFDDSLLHSLWLTENKLNWDFFANHHNYINGGEFSYYTNRDQRKALHPNGPNGISLAMAAQLCNLTFVIGDGQPEHNRAIEIAEAGRLLGYQFKVISAKTNGLNTIICIENDGVAAASFDIYPSIDGSKANENLRGLLPGQSIEVILNVNYSDHSALELTSPKLLPGQEIPFIGN